MRTVRTTFDEVSIQGQRSGKCRHCEKRTSRTRKFWQTINPWNKNKKGGVKSHQQILKEIKAQRNKWESKKPICSRCENMLSRKARIKLEKEHEIK